MHSDHTPVCLQGIAVCWDTLTPFCFRTSDLAGDLVIGLTTPNDRSISQPTGLETQELTLREDPLAETMIVAVDNPIAECIIRE
jgi:hypothetical protein